MPDVPDDALVVRGQPKPGRAALRTSMSNARIFADFHNADERGRVRLNCAGTIQDLSSQNVRLVPGLALTLYSEDVEAEGVVEYSNEEHLWVAVVDWKALLGESDPSANGVAHHSQVPIS